MQTTTGRERSTRTCRYSGQDDLLQIFEETEGGERQGGGAAVSEERDVSGVETGVAGRMQIPETSDHLS